MDTYHVSLTKVSDNSVSHDFLLAEGREGQPRVRLGSREKEAAKAGQRGTIVIESLHHGSGQHVVRDPMMYEVADGMFADDPGKLKVRGEIKKVIPNVSTAQSFRSWARGAMFGKSSLITLETDPFIVVLPTQIVEVTSNASVGKINPAAGALFTGSHARHGRYVFFGQELIGNSTHSHYSTWAARYDTHLGIYTNNAGFKASFVASQGDKMWKAEKKLVVNHGEANLAWTDDTNATPVFSADFTKAVSALDVIRDMAIIGPHAIMAIARSGELGTNLVAVDTSGMFTEILSGLPPVLQFTPFLGGQLLWLAGRPRALWFQDLFSFREVAFGGVEQPVGEGSFPSFPLASTPARNVGLGVAEAGSEVIFGLYGTYRKRDGNAVSGSILAQAVLKPDGMFFHTLATPESTNTLVNAHIIAAALYPAWDAATPDPVVPRRLYYVTATPEANAANSSVELCRMDMWDGSVPPTNFDATAKFLRTSRYVGDSWTTKQGEMLRGYISVLLPGASVVVRIYLDGNTGETASFSINSIGPFAQALPSNIIGRDIALDFETTANGSVIAEFPWSLDYFAVPDQKDIVRLPVVAGRDQITPGGPLTDKTRAKVLDNLAALCASPERWTLEWWDETPDWDVLPLSYEGAETEPAHVEGAGAAVAWLTLQRL